MSEIAIRAEGLGKRYKIGRRKPSLFDRLKLTPRATTVASPSESNGESGSQDFWALKDVSFEVKRGEAIGIIGRNGAGKSTLLKILARITEPSAGRGDIHGRVASLLEVGTGFHPDLTGRENVYLNGALLGMRGAEVRSQFDEIVEFAELAQFIDTPVKQYSSGMYMRLAFAVAAHLMAEIVLVDEALAVGDIEFQRKCIGKLSTITGEGRTALMVSHSMESVRALCSRSFLLEAGALTMVDRADAVVSRYLHTRSVGGADRLVEVADHRKPVSIARVHRVTLLNPAGGRFCVHWRQPIHVRIEIEFFEPSRDIALGAAVETPQGMSVFTVQHDDGHVQSLREFEAGLHAVEVRFENTLRPGTYQLVFGADRSHLMVLNFLDVPVATFEVLGFTENGEVASPSNAGVVNGHSQWVFP